MPTRATNGLKAGIWGSTARTRPLARQQIFPGTLGGGLYNGFVMNTGIMDSVVVSGNTNTAGSIGTASVTSNSYGI